MEYEYKVIDVADGAISSFLLGEGRIETNVLQAYINAMASEGWRLIFMEKVMQRHLLISDRETLMVTFERRVPESERHARAARCIDDVIEAEDAAKRQGYKAAAGAVAATVGSAVVSHALSSTSWGNGNNTSSDEASRLLAWDSSTQDDSSINSSIHEDMDDNINDDTDYEINEFDFDF